MEAAILFSALLLMPIYAMVFIASLFNVLKKLKAGKEFQGVEVVCGISFALMMWTLSSTIVLGSS